MVEYVDEFGFWELFFDVLQEVVFVFFGCWGFEGCECYVLWVDFVYYMVYDVVFFGGVYGLQYQQYGVFCCVDVIFGEQLFLQFVEVVEFCCEVGLFLGFVVVVFWFVVWVEVGEVEIVVDVECLCLGVCVYMYILLVSVVVGF